MIPGLLVSACAAAPRTVTVEVHAPWPGASVEQLDAELAPGLDAALRTLPIEDLRVELVPGLARATFVLPLAALPSTNGALHAAALPQGAPPPWPQVRPETSTTFVITGADAATLVRAAGIAVEVGSQWWGPDKIFASTDTAEVWTGRLVATDLPDGGLPRGGPLEDVLATEVSGRPLSAWLDGAPTLTPPERRATWDDAPAAVLHVAGDGADLERIVRERWPELTVVATPKKGVRVDLWGTDAEDRAAEVVAAARAAGAAHVGVIVGRSPLPGPPARRAEVFVDGLDAVPGFDGVSWTRAKDARPWLEGAVETEPPPGSEYAVSLDPDRLAALGVSAEDVARQVRLITVGVGVPVDGGLLRLRSGAEPTSVEALAAATVHLPTGEDVPLSALADVTLTEALRYRVHGR